MNKIPCELELLFSFVVHHNSSLRMVQTFHFEELHYRDCKVIWASNAWCENPLHTYWLVDFRKVDLQRCVMNVSQWYIMTHPYVGALEICAFRDKTKLILQEPVRKHDESETSTTAPLQIVLHLGWAISLGNGKEGLFHNFMTGYLLEWRKGIEKFGKS